MNVPKEKVAQIHEFVKDLAVGYDEGIWDPIFSYMHALIKRINGIWNEAKNLSKNCVVINETIIYPAFTGYFLWNI